MDTKTEPQETSSHMRSTNKQLYSTVRNQPLPNRRGPNELDRILERIQAYILSVNEA